MVTLYQARRQLTPLLFSLLWMWLGVAHAEPDEEVLGKGAGYPISSQGGFMQMPNRVGNWSALDKVPGVRIAPVAKGEQVMPLPKAGLAPEIRYRHRNLAYTLNDYLDRRRITGLLILKNGEIVAEHYRYGRTEDARFLSFSMAKSVTSLLVGAALSRGLIRTIDDPAGQYVKALEGSGYGQTSIRHLLRMAQACVLQSATTGKTMWPSSRAAWPRVSHRSTPCCAASATGTAPQVKSLLTPAPKPKCWAEF